MSVPPSPPSSKINRKFGWGNFTPDCLQKFHTVKLLVFLLTVANCLSILEKGYLISIMEALQNSYSFSNLQIGLIVSAGNFITLFATLPIAHWLQNGHKGRWIAISETFSVLASLAMTLPHFLVHKQTSTARSYGNVVIDADNNNHTILNDSFIDFTNGMSSTSLSDETQRTNSSNAAFAIFICVQLASSLCVSLKSVQLSYVEENSKQNDIALYSTLITGLPSIFFSTGFLIAPMMKVMGITHQNTNVDTWWIGFLIAPSISVFFLMPMYGFAAKLPEYDTNRVADINQCHESNKSGKGQNGVTNQRFTTTVTSLLRNNVYLMLVLRGAVSMMVIVGVTTFITIYLQHVFGFSKTESDIITSIGWILFYVIGNVIGSIIVKVYKFLVKQIIVLCLVSMIVSTGLFLIFLLKCNQFDWKQNDSNFINEFNSCQERILQEGSHLNSTTSRRHKVCLVELNVTILIDAPCADASSISASDSYTDHKCKCLKILKKYYEHPLHYTTRRGVCFRDYYSCKWKKILFAVIITLASILGGIGATPAWQAILLSVVPSQRTVSVGLASTINVFLGMIGPVIVGLGFDKLCLALTKTVNGSKVCSHYDTNGLSVYVTMLMLGSGIFGVVVLGIAVKLYKPAESLSTRVIDVKMMKKLSTTQQLELKCKLG